MKRVFRKKPLAIASQQGSSEEQLGMSGVFRQQINAPVSVLGIALSLGASASLVSIPGLAFAAEGSTVVVLPAVDDLAQASGSEYEAVAEVSSVTAYHTVTEGDSLWEIAAQHQADVSTIEAVNGISQDDVLIVGQVLRVPAESVASTLVSRSPEASTLAIGTAVGSFGGDVPVLSPDSSAVAVLSVDDLEKNWVTLDEAEELDGISPQTKDAEPLQTDSLAVSDAEKGLTAKADLVAVELKAETVVTPEATASTETLSEGEAKTTAPESTDAWQDASAQLAAAQPSEGATAFGSEAESLAQAASAFPQSIPLNEVSSRPSDTGASLSQSSTATASSVSNARVSQLPAGGQAATVMQMSQPQSALFQPALESESAKPAMAVVEPAPLTREQVIQEHLARIRESNNTLVDRGELNARIRQARQELERTRLGLAGAPAPATRSSYSALQVAPATEASSTPLAAASLSTDAVERKQSSTQLQAWTVTDVAEVESATEEAPLAAAPTSVAPQPELPAASEPVATDRPLSTGGEHLLAAAPLGAEVYRPFPEMPTGQMVSPDMPLLPGAEQFLPEAPNRFNGYIWPARGTFTSGYGWRWGRMHRGIDIAGPVGTPIVAAASGVVVRSGWNSGGYGNLVDIRHPDGSMTRYAHNSRLLVREGQQVSQGQQIAAMGSTGYSTGPHLHFEIHLAGSGTVNPMAYLPGR